MENQKVPKLTWRWNGKFVTEKQYNLHVRRSKIFKEAREKRKQANRDELENEPKCIVEGSRVVDLQILAKYLFCRTCKICLSLRDVEREVRHGFASLFIVKCPQCNILTYVPTSKKLLNLTTQKTRYQVNTRIATGCVQAGLSYGKLTRFLQALDVPCMSQKTFQLHKEYVTSTSKDQKTDSEDNGPKDVEIGSFDKVVTNVVNDSTEVKSSVEIIPRPAKQVASIRPEEPSVKTPLVTRSFTRKLTLPEFQPLGKRSAALKKPCECCTKPQLSSRSKKRKCHVQEEVKEKDKKKTTKGRKSQISSVDSRNEVNIFNAITPKTEPCYYEPMDHDYLGHHCMQVPEAAATVPSFEFVGTCKMEVDQVDEVTVKIEINDSDLDAYNSLNSGNVNEGVDDSSNNVRIADTVCTPNENYSAAVTVAKKIESVDSTCNVVNNTGDSSDRDDSVKVEEVFENSAVGECDEQCISST